MNDQQLPNNYMMGYTQDAIQRLFVQSQLINPFTQRLLEDAGVSRGMHVLDVGCGPGDVSLIAASLVGEEGSVLGVDINADMLTLAKRRAQESGLRHTSFQVADLRNLALTQQFDAIVGRFILLHMPEPIPLLQRLLAHLRPGGLIAFQDFDLAPQRDATMPASPLWEQVTIWAIRASEQAGMEVRMGMKLWSTFQAAGLPAPQMRYEAAIGAGPQWAGYEYMAGVIRDLLPPLVKFGIATAEEIEVETLALRLREQVTSQGGMARLPAIVSAWTHSEA